MAVNAEKYDHFGKKEPLSFWSSKWNLRNKL